MENEDIKLNKPSRDELLNEFLEDSPQLKHKKLTLILRFIGFFLLVTAFAVLFLKGSEIAHSPIRTLVLGVGVIGFVIYFGSRLFEIIYPRVAKRKSA